MPAATESMFSVLIALFAGGALGAIAMSFLAVAAYDRGYADAVERRRAWSRELTARQAAAKQRRVSSRSAA